MNNILTQDDFYFCYQADLSNYLKGKGIRYLLKSRSVKDSNIFTLYLKTEQLDQAIDEYKAFCKKCI